MIDIRTVTGRRIDLEHPRAEDIEIADIARGLSHCCRFAGQLPSFYCVAQHSVLVAELCDPSLRLAGLLHDGTEAYMGDLSRNLKHSEFLDGYRMLEGKLAQAIQLRFGYLTSREDLVHIKHADNLAACFERVWLRQQRPWEGLEDLCQCLRDGYVRGEESIFLPLMKRLPRALVGWEPRVAESVFIGKFGEYQAS